MKAFPVIRSAGVLLLLVLAPSSVSAQELSTAEASLLSQMDSKTIAEILSIAGQIEGWRRDLIQFRSALEKAQKESTDLLSGPTQAADIGDAVLKIARRLRICSPALRKQIGFDEKIERLLKGLENATKLDITPDDFPDVDVADLRAFATELLRGAAVQEIADALEKSVLDKIKSLRNPAQFANNFIEQKLKSEYFNKPYTVGSLTFQIDQRVFSTSVFSPQANIAIVVVHPESGARVKARGLYFKYKYPVPEPVTSKLVLETPGVEDLIILVKKYLPPIGPISIDKDVPVTVTPAKDGKGNTTRFGLLLDFSELKEVGLDAVKAKVKVAVSSSGNVTIDGASVKVPLRPAVVLGNTSLLITSVSVGLPARNKIDLGLTVSTVAGEENTLFANITATVGFPIAKEGIALRGDLWLNKAPLARVTGSMNKDGLTVSLASDAITGGTGTLTIKGTLTRQGLDASAQFAALFGLANATGTLHLGTDGHGSLSVTCKATPGIAEIDASLSSSFSPGFKNLVFKGAVSIDIPDDYLGLVTAEVDVSGQLLPSPKLRARGHVGPVDFPEVELSGNNANFHQLVAELKKALLKARQEFYKFLADAESKASKYADERTRVFAGWISQNAKNIGLDKLATGNPTVDKALGDLSKGAKDLGGQAADVTHHAGKQISDEYHKVFGLRSATISTGANGGFGLTSNTPFDKAFADIESTVHKLDRKFALEAQLAPVTKALDQVVVHREKSGSVGQVAGLRLRTSRVLSHADGEHDAHLTLLVQVTSFRYTIDRKKGLLGPIARASNLYVADIALHGLDEEGHRPTVQILFPTLHNVAPWDAASLLRAELTRRIDAKLDAIRLTDRFEERRLYLHNLTDEPLTAHVQVETRTGANWHWLPAGPGSSYKSFQVAVPAHQMVPVRLGKDTVAQGRRARIWASSSAGHVWTPYANRDVLLVHEKDKEGRTGYFGRSMQNFRFWFATPAAKTTTLHERLISVRNNTRFPLLVTAEIALHKDHGQLEWEPTAQPVRIQAESTVELRHTHNLPLRGSAIRFRAEDEKRQVYRWVGAWRTPVGTVDPRGYSAASLGTTLLVLEPPRQPTASRDSPTAANVTLHIPAEEVMLPAVKNMPLLRAKKLLEEKGFRVVSEPSAGDPLIVKQEPDAGWHRPSILVRLTAHVPENSRTKPIPVPQFKGMSLAKAEELAGPLHLIVKPKNAERVPTRETRDRTLVGKTVIETQEPPAETRVKANAVIAVSLVHYVAVRPTPPGPTRK